MNKDVNSEIEMIVETGAEPEQTASVASEKDAAAETADLSKQSEKPAMALKRIKESTSEDEERPVGTLTLKQILGGDYLFALVRHHVVLIIFVVFFFVFYIGVRYQCEQDVLEINQLEKDLVDAKYRALSSSSNLTELCRQSNVLRVLHENQDTLLHLSDQPPYIIEVPED